MKLKALVSSFLTTTALISVLPATTFADNDNEVTRAALPKGAIEHILVIDLENENYNSTFGATSPAVYLNTTRPTAPAAPGGRGVQPHHG